MPFTAGELQNIANASLEYFWKKGSVFSQSLQNKPLLKAMRANKETFPGGKDEISVAVKGDYTTTIQGYSHDSVVGYQNPANIKRAKYPWREIHAGLSLTLTELKIDGISVTDSANGKGTSNHSQREKHVLVNLLKDKLEDMQEGYSRGMNNTLWRDGTADPLLFPGIKSFIVDDPTLPVVIGGLDQSLLPWWRNRSVLGISTAAPQNSTIAQTLQKDYRQLTRYTTPRLKWFAGSDFLDALEIEQRANGTYTDNGWAKSGGIDMSVADVKFKGMSIMYDPTLDDEGEADRCYALDMKEIKLMPMQGEEDKQHNPARPEDRYVLYRALTWTGGLVCKRRNSSAVYSIA